MILRPGLLCHFYWIFVLLDFCFYVLFKLISSFGYNIWHFQYLYTMIMMINMTSKCRSLSIISNLNSFGHINFCVYIWKILIQLFRTWHHIYIIPISYFQSCLSFNCPTSYNSAEGAIKNCTGRVNLLTSDFHLEIPSISYAWKGNLKKKNWM